MAKNIVVVTEKVCTGCGELKPVEGYYKDKRASDGRASRCRACHYKYTIASRKNKPEWWKQYNRERSRLRRQDPEYKKKKAYWDWAKDLQYKYNINEQQYHNMFIKQSGRCAICSIHQSRLTKRLAVDHHHGSGAVRGLLCDACNVGLGRFKDDAELVLLAYNYLRSTI